MNNSKKWIALGVLGAALMVPAVQAQTTPADSSANRSSVRGRQPYSRFDRKFGDRGPRRSQDEQPDGYQQHGPRPPRGPWAEMRQDGRGSGMEHRFHQGTFGLTALTIINGTVGQLTSNDDSILDGFTLTSSASTTNVSFAPHLGQQVQQAIKPGSAVSVTGFAEKNREGTNQFRMISLTASKITIMETHPARPSTPPAAPTLTTVTGKIIDYKISRRGQVNGLVMTDNVIVRIPPHVAYQLTNLATKGTTVTVQGYARPLREGQVQLRPLTILRASVLTINGQQYLVR